MFKVLLTALVPLLSTPVFAQVIPDNVARLEFDTGWRESDGVHVAGLTIRLAPGWKTYWRAPGDGGIPPRFNWSGSSNVKGATVQFPVPDVWDVNGLRTIGYENAVTFPIRFAVADASQPAKLRAEVEIGVCEEICVPVVLRFQAVLPVKGNDSALLKATLSDRPERGGRMSCSITPIEDGLRLVATSRLPDMGMLDAVVIEAGETGVWVSGATSTRKGRTISAEVEMVPPSAQPFALARSDVRMTVLAGGRAVEMIGCE